MDIVIAGSRTIMDKALVFQVIADSGFHITKVISGGAKGVDQLGEAWSLEILKKLPLIIKPDYTRFDKYLAPKMRNNEMSKRGDGLIAIWNGTSRGTKHMIECMNKRCKPVYVHIWHDSQCWFSDY